MQSIGKSYPSKPSEEVQSLLTLLFVQDHKVFKNLHINLQGSWLNKADLMKARLDGANLMRAHLQGANSAGGPSARGESAGGAPAGGLV